MGRFFVDTTCHLLRHLPAAGHRHVLGRPGSFLVRSRMPAADEGEERVRRTGAGGLPRRESIGADRKAAAAGGRSNIPGRPLADGVVLLRLQPRPNRFVGATAISWTHRPGNWAGGCTAIRWSRWRRGWRAAAECGYLFPTHPPTNVADPARYAERFGAERIHSIDLELAGAAGARSAVDRRAGSG